MEGPGGGAPGKGMADTAPHRSGPVEPGPGGPRHDRGHPLRAEPLRLPCGRGRQHPHPGGDPLRLLRLPHRLYPLQRPGPGRAGAHRQHRLLQGVRGFHGQGQRPESGHLRALPEHDHPGDREHPLRRERSPAGHPLHHPRGVHGGGDRPGPLRGGHFGGAGGVPGPLQGRHPPVRGVSRWDPERFRPALRPGGVSVPRHLRGL